MERILNETEKQNFETVARLSQVICEETGAKYEVKDTYLDYGQGWKWTTIVYTQANGKSYQILSPKQWKEILNLENKTECLKWVMENIES